MSLNVKNGHRETHRDKFRDNYKWTHFAIKYVSKLLVYRAIFFAMENEIFLNIKRMPMIFQIADLLQNESKLA